MRALDDEVRAGRILYLGISDTPAWIVSQANTLAHWRGWTAFAGCRFLTACCSATSNETCCLWRMPSG